MADDGIIGSGEDDSDQDSGSAFSETYQDIAENHTVSKNNNFEIIKKSLMVKNVGGVFASNALSDSDSNFSDTCRPPLH